MMVIWLALSACGGETSPYSGDWHVRADGNTRQDFTMHLFRVSDGEWHGRLSEIPSGDMFVVFRTKGTGPMFCVMPGPGLECDYGYALTMTEEVDKPLTLVGPAKKWYGRAELPLSEVVRLEMTHL